MWSIVELVKSFLWQQVGQQGDHTATHPLGGTGSHHIVNLLAVSCCGASLQPHYQSTLCPSCLCNKDYGYAKNLWGCVLQIIWLVATYVDLNKLLLHVTCYALQRDSSMLISIDSSKK